MHKSVITSIVLAVILIPALILTLYFEVRPRSSSNDTSVSGPITSQKFIPTSGIPDEYTTVSAVVPIPTISPVSTQGNPFILNSTVNTSFAISRKLFDSTLSKKLLSFSQNQPNPIAYPDLTTSDGRWVFRKADWWTSGFYPATMYAMHNRAVLCKSGQMVANGWKAIGQSWSSGEIPLALMNSVGHDVGFLSLPFIQELRM